MAFWTQWLQARNRPPWGTGPSILGLIRAWDGQSPLRLPDQMDGDEPPLASGALDGLATHHSTSSSKSDQSKTAQEILAALRKQARSGSERSRRAVYRLALETPVSAYADALISALARDRACVLVSLREPARWLVQAATDREPLKLGVLLVGSCGAPEDVAVLLEVARHDEFTLYAAVSAGNLLDDPTDVWWAMARNVRGWGKIHVVERLRDRALDRPDVQDWLIRHGCDNDVLPEYLAGPCAQAGRLAQALEAGRPDDELLDGACVIFGALISRGALEDLSCYDDGVAAATALIHQLATRCDTPERLELVAAFLEWLERPETPHVARARETAGWTPETRADQAARCRRILGQSRPTIV